MPKRSDVQGGNNTNLNPLPVGIAHQRLLYLCLFPAGPGGIGGHLSGGLASPGDGLAGGMGLAGLSFTYGSVRA